MWRRTPLRLRARARSRSDNSPRTFGESSRPNRTWGRASVMKARSSAANKGRRQCKHEAPSTKSETKNMQHKPKSNSELRKRRHARVRAQVKGTSARPRLAVFRSNRFVSAQLIDDTAGTTLVAPHGRAFKGPQSVQAKAVGEATAKAAK